MDTLLTLMAVAAVAYFVFTRIAKRPNRQPVTATGTAADYSDWFDRFAIYFVAKELRMSGGMSMPSSIMQILEGAVPSSLQQSLLVSLNLYLSYDAQRDKVPSDYNKALQALRSVLRSEFRRVRSREAIEAYVRDDHRRATGSELSDVESKQITDQLLQAIKASEDGGTKIYSSVLNVRFQRLFAESHNRTLDEFTEAVYKHYEDSVCS
ncbi:hypothetical protein LB559_18185 [Mesorhizobium sp. BR1-1-3]|uniref:hypothetical protein n=1 Tax=Mesorhizobium sp. BR1-1-3 TaxID=2876651 RepID=UPI001CD10776|nr:hypothetical protein [Mesorhizobium sp. BR1-1-3]MBZ9889856.1 hypothetical protein [Mesorhizobium sp. BR1-1-3]